MGRKGIENRDEEGDKSFKCSQIFIDQTMQYLTSSIIYTRFAITKGLCYNKH